MSRGGNYGRIQAIELSSMPLIAMPITATHKLEHYPLCGKIIGTSADTFCIQASGIDTSSGCEIIALSW